MRLRQERRLSLPSALLVMELVFCPVMCYSYKNSTNEKASQRVKEE